MGGLCIYTKPNSQQLRATVLAIHNDPSGRVYADIREFNGGDYQGVAITSLQPTTPEAVGLTPDSLRPVTPYATTKLWLAQSKYTLIAQALSLKVAMGQVQVGETIYQNSVTFPDQTLCCVDVVNGQSGPYVDAYLLNPATGESLGEVPPRDTILGTFDLRHPGGNLYRVEVQVRS